MCAGGDPIPPGAERLLHLVRHGETAGQSSIRLWGKTDVPLSDIGRAQVRRLAGIVAGLRVDAVVHSPLARAVESARILTEALAVRAVPTHTEAAFAEIDFGAFEGLTADEIAVRDPAWFARWRKGEHLGYPEGDSVADFRSRVQVAFARLLATTAGDVLVVAHRGVIRHIADAVLPGAGKPPTDLASLSTLRLDPPAVERWNVRG